MRRVILTAAICLSAMLPQQILAVQDSIMASLVTCSPGALIYEVYGHTALRIQDFSNGTDIVYNYGMFNFNSPHFIWRWLRGETDYLLGKQSWSQFVDEYMSRGSTVYVQELGISREDRQQLSAMLYENSKPENRTYRYDFLRNNCATMALDRIEEAAEGAIRYCESDTAFTYRDILHEFNSIEPWNSFGVDLITGAEADTRISRRETAFAPIRLMRMLDNATITDTAGIAIPLITDTYEIRPQEPLQFTGCNISPLQAMILILLLTLMVCCIEWNVRRIFWITDIIIFSAQGIAGIIICFLVLFSSHPTASSNWLAICLNPIPLICLPFVIRNLIRRRKDIFLIYNFIVITVFLILSSRIPQHIAPATLVMLGIFAIRSLSDIHFVYNMSIHKLFSKKSGSGRHLAAMAILALSVPAIANAQTRQTPKLVVGIVIDQLDREYVRRLMPLFGDDGFRRFWYHGYNIPNASFDYDCRDRASAIASIYTGATPFYHGIVGTDWIERKSLSRIGAVDDNEERGINTIDRCSPKRLQVFTVTDQLEIQSNGGSITCSIAAERDAAILAGGHDPDIVLWMNDADGQWCTSSYYGTYPSWATGTGSDESWNNNEWRPLLPSVYYTNTSNDPRTKTFSYRFSRGETQDIKTSPIANDRITGMAIKSIDALKLGSAGATDFLALTLYAGGLRHMPSGLESMELQDTYARLDRNLADLIDHIDKKIGIDNVLFFLTSTGYRDTESRVQPSYSARMPYGSVNMEHVTALLNLYLSAIYETGEYICTYNGNQLYINRDLLEKSGIPIQAVYDHCTDLLLQMSGIRGVFTQRDLMSPNLSNDARRKRDALNPSCSGDLVIETIPGWTIIDEKHGTSHLATRSVTEFPIMLYGSGIRAYMDERPTSASSLAATVSWISGIPTPDACSSTPITGIW